MNAEECQELRALFPALRDIGAVERTRLIQQHRSEGSWLCAARVQCLTRAKRAKYAPAMHEVGQGPAGDEVRAW